MIILFSAGHAGPLFRFFHPSRSRGRWLLFRRGHQCGASAGLTWKGFLALGDRYPADFLHGDHDRCRRHDFRPLPGRHPHSLRHRRLGSGSARPGTVIMAIIFAIYIIGGAVMDALALLLITIPIFFPVAQELGYDPIWFGVTITVVTTLGAVTPPVGPPPTWSAAWPKMSLWKRFSKA